MIPSPSQTLVVASLAASLAVSASAQVPTVTAFVHVAVIPMDRERVLTDQTVLVQGDRIIALGPAPRIRVPPEATIIDGSGKFLIPGLADMHSHTTDHDGLVLYLANGVTTIRNMSFGSDLLMLRERLAGGELMPPRVYGVGRMDDCKGTSLVQCFAEMKTHGVDMLKLYGDGTENPARLDSIVTATRAVGLPIGGHVLPGPGLERALRVPYRSIEHLWGYIEFLLHASSLPPFMTERAMLTEPSPLDTMAWVQPGYRLDPKALQAVAVATRRAGTWNAPTLGMLEADIAGQGAQKNGIARSLDRVMRRRFELHLQLVKALQEAGAGLLLSTDWMGEPGLGGFVVHRELELLVEAGLTSYQALATGTREVARYLGTLDSAGTVAVGKHADLVLLDEDPLRDIRYTAGPAGVMAAGRWFSRVAIEAQLDTLAAQGCDLRALRREAALHQGLHQATLAATQERLGAYNGACGPRR